MKFPDNDVTSGFRTVQEFGLALGVPAARVQTWIRDGRLPAVRLGRLVLVPNDALRMILQAMEVSRG